ncbi:imm11 family protein [Longicatena caecimuris]|uniref:imm11 family protein n=1 Tax=Longicatena caecimuris TaxID=1796635 RepID=UPI000E73DADF|nr:DUF1629 domain-containing protein [Longicatena caecimuris]RJV89288.1 hypothetical protein DWX13_00365 [Eubacterium sp. AF18-3]
MKIYRIWHDENFRVFEPLNNTLENRNSLNFDGAVLKEWESIPLVASNYKTEKKLLVGDISFTGDVSSFLLNEQSYNILYPIIKDSAQFFRTESNYGDLYVVNVTCVLDCLDREKSNVVLFPSSERIMAIKEFAFSMDMIGNNILFKIPEKSKSFSFATEEFKKIVEENGLTGIKFIPLWDSEK